MSDNGSRSSVLVFVALAAIAVAQVLAYPDGGINPGLVLAAGLLLILFFSQRRRDVGRDEPPAGEAERPAGADGRQPEGR